MQFDQVIVGPPNERRTLTREQFLGLPSEVRIKHMLLGDIEFLQKGVVLPRAKALRTITPTAFVPVRVGSR